MFCQKCGRKMDDNERFCTACGAPRPQIPPRGGAGQPEPPSAAPNPERIPPAAPQGPSGSAAPAGGGERPFSPRPPVNPPYTPPQQPRVDPPYTPPRAARPGGGAVPPGLEAVIGKNTEYYMAQFQRIAAGEKAKFNWAAFFLNIYFCFYRKCGRLFQKYFLLPWILITAACVVAAAALAVFSVPLLIGCSTVATAGAVWALVNAIRLGRNFNREYYQHASAALAARDEKRYGVSWPSAIICAAVYLLIYSLVGAAMSVVITTHAATLFSPPESGGADVSYGTPDLSMQQPDQPALPPDVSAPQEDAAVTAPSAQFTSGTFTDTGSAASVYTSGGLAVELTVDGARVDYTVTAVSASQRIASISGAAAQGNVISVSGDDGWGNLVEGTITALDADTVAVEFSVVTQGPNAMWALSCLYTELARCPDEVPATSDELDFGSIADVYYLADDSTIQMSLRFSSDMTGVNSANWQGSEPLELHFQFVSPYEILADGVAYWWPLSGGMPYFEGELYSSLESIVVEYDGYGCLVNCPALDLYNAYFCPL